MMMMMTMLAGPPPSIIRLTISSRPGELGCCLGNSPQISSHSAHPAFDGRRAPWGRYPRTHARYTGPGSSQLNLRHIHVPTFDPMAVVLKNFQTQLLKSFHSIRVKLFQSPWLMSIKWIQDPIITRRHPHIPDVWRPWFELIFLHISTAWVWVCWVNKDPWCARPTRCAGPRCGPGRPCLCPG